MSDNAELDAKRKWKKHAKKVIRDAEMEKGASLNMTSLMDIFVNVLIYLLMNYSTSPIDISQSEERTLPKSSTKLEIKHTTTVEVTTKSIIVDRQKILEIQDWRVDSSHKKDKSASSFLIVPLQSRLKEELARKKKIAKLNSSVKETLDVITIVADHRMPFRLLSEVMYTAGQSEFAKFKFAVVKKGE